MAIGSWRMETDVRAFAVRRFAADPTSYHAAFRPLKRVAVSQSRLEGKKILITGASQGIGAALAQRLHELGARVALLGRDVEALEAVSANWTSKDDALVLAADVGNARSMTQAFALLSERFGSLDAVIANAAILARGPFESMSEMDLERIVATNVLGALLTVRLAMPLLRNAEDGRIVLVGSYAGRRGTPFAAAYSATKGALVAFADALRAELSGTPIRVSLVSPGPTRTQIHARALGGAVTTDATTSAADSAELVIRALRSGEPYVEATKAWRVKGILGMIAPRLYDAWIRRRLT